MNRGRFPAVLLLTASLLAALLPVRGVEAEPRTLQIDSAQDLAAFSRACVTDSYSRDLRVELTADIDLTDTELEPIPIFAGVFDGGGHTISGFRYDGGGYVRGLFRYLTETAQVCSLTLDVDMCPSSDKTVIGGLCGENSGLIENCTVSGSVSGEEDVGGVAGVNTADGRILGCRSLAVVEGERRTGGIAGDNAGTIFSCKNRGPVNGTPKELAECTGGIAGRSTGRIASCENGGVIGYPRTGYNVGGIVGKQNGDVEYCSNRGNVRGRKDVGGIAGQSEPAVSTEYVNKLNRLDASLASLPDQLKGLNSQMDTAANDLLDIVNETASALRAASGQLDAGMAQLEEHLAAAVEETNQGIENASQHLGYASEHLDTAIRELEDASAGVQRAVTDFSMTVTPDILFTAQDVQNLIEAIRKDPISTESLDQLIALLEKWSMTASLGSNASAGLSDAVADTRDALEALRQAVSALRTAEQYIDGATENTLSGVSGAVQDLSATIDQVDGVLAAYAARVDTLSTSAKESLTQIQATLNGIVDTLDQARAVVSDIIAGPANTQEDISDRRESGLGGAVAGCRNLGDIEADYNAGGIIGNAAQELGDDPEKDLEIDPESIVFSDSRSVFRLAIQSCRNDGAVSAKYSRSGGIVGRGTGGTILDCRNYGDIQTEDTYCGGIAGEYGGRIKACQALGSITAAGLAGGIAGTCVDMADCYSMVVLHSEGGQLGALAGTASGDLSGNYFVSDTLGGVDGINYDGKAMPITYEALMETEAVADIFRYLTVSFSVEGDIIWSDKTPYGGSITQVPEVADRDGQYWVWEPFDRSNIVCSMTVEGEYVSPRTTISTGGAIPDYLVEGSFFPHQTLRVTEISDPELGTAVLSSGRAEVQPDYLDSLRLRVRCADEGLLYVSEDGAWVRRAYVRDGSYLVFDLENGGSFALVEMPQDSSAWWLAGGGAVLLAAAAILVALCRRRKRRRKDAHEEKGEDTNAKA